MDAHHSSVRCSLRPMAMTPSAVGRRTSAEEPITRVVELLRAAKRLPSCCRESATVQTLAWAVGDPTVPPERSPRIIRHWPGLGQRGPAPECQKDPRSPAKQGGANVRNWPRAAAGLPPTRVRFLTRIFSMSSAPSQIIFHETRPLLLATIEPLCLVCLTLIQHHLLSRLGHRFDAPYFKHGRVFRERKLYHHRPILLVYSVLFVAHGFFSPVSDRF